MEGMLTSFLISVVASVVGYYICSNSQNGLVHRNEQKNPQRGNSEGFCFAYWKLTNFLSYNHYMLE